MKDFCSFFLLQKTEIQLKPINRLLVIIAVTASLILSQTFIWSGKKIVWKRLPNESRRRRYIRTIYWYYIYISDFWVLSKKINELTFSLFASCKYYFFAILNMFMLYFHMFFHLSNRNNLLPVLKKFFPIGFF